MKSLLFLSNFFVVLIITASTNRLSEFMQTPSSEEITTTARKLLRHILPLDTWPDENIMDHPLMIFIEEKKSFLINNEIRPQTLFLKIKDVADEYGRSKRQRKNCALLLTICFFQSHQHLLILLKNRYKEIEIMQKPSYERFLDQKLKEIHEYFENNKKEE